MEDKDLDTLRSDINLLTLSQIGEAELPSFAEAENDLRFTINRHIHDSIQQDIGMVMLRLAQQEQELTYFKSKVGEMLEDNQLLVKMLDKANTELSNLRRQILPIEQYNTMFALAVESYILEIFPQLHPDVKFDISYDLAALGVVYDQRKYFTANATSEKLLISLFVREGLQNAYKHSRATRVELLSKIIYYNRINPSLDSQLKKPVSGYYLALSVTDNGRGFVTDELTGRPSSLTDFEYRASLLNGFTSIETVQEVGTKWMLHIPIRLA